MQDDNGAAITGRPDGPQASMPRPGAGTAGVPLASEPGAAPGRALAVQPPGTGESRVDAALSLLDDLTELPVTEHPAVFERVHAELGEVLGELGSGSLVGPAGREGS